MSFTFTYGTNGDDVIMDITKRNTNQEIYGYGGNDAIAGGNGDDWIDAGSGDDTIFVNNGDNIINGGSGSDDIFIGFDKGVVFSLSKKGWQNTGECWLKVKNVENVISGNYDDTIFGNNASNWLNGQGGDDWLDGGRGGVDTLVGGEGEDTFAMNKGKGNAVIHDYSFEDDWIYFKGNSRLLGLYDGNKGQAELWNGNDLLAVIKGASGSELISDGGGYFYLA